MIIAFEGPDGCGKSVAANELSKIIPSRVIHPGPPPGSLDVAEKMMANQLKDIMTKEVVIYDRLTCISQYVYHPLRNPDTKMSLNQRNIWVFNTVNFILQFAATSILLVYCRPTVDTILKSCTRQTVNDTEKTQELVRNQMELIIERYDHIFSFLSDNFDVTHFDYEKHRVVDLLPNARERLLCLKEISVNG